MSFVQVCSIFLKKCYDVVSEYSGVISKGLQLYQSYTYDFKLLLQEIDNANFLLLEFNKLIMRLESLQNQYNLTICSLEKAKKFSSEMYQFLEKTGKDIDVLSTLNERAFAKWYRDELKFYVEYLNTFTQYTMSDIDFIYQQAGKKNVNFLKQSLQCKDLYYK